MKSSSSNPKLSPTDLKEIELLRISSTVSLQGLQEAELERVATFFDKTTNDVSEWDDFKDELTDDDSSKEVDIVIDDDTKEAKSHHHHKPVSSSIPQTTDYTILWITSAFVVGYTLALI